MKKARVESSKRVFQDILSIDEAFVSYELPNGSMSPVVRRLKLDRGDSAAAVIYNRTSQTVLLTRQFRYPTLERGPGWMTELVAGMIDKGESPEETICREILEEIGYRVRQPIPICTVYVSPGGSSERIFIYGAMVEAADKVAAGGGLASETEDIETIEVPRREIAGMLAEGELNDAKTVIGLNWLERRLAAEGAALGG